MIDRLDRADQMELVDGRVVESRPAAGTRGADHTIQARPNPLVVVQSYVDILPDR